MTAKEQLIEEIQSRPKQAVACERILVPTDGSSMRPSIWRLSRGHI